MSHPAFPVRRAMYRLLLAFRLVSYGLHVAGRAGMLSASPRQTVLVATVVIAAVDILRWPI